MSNWGEGDPLKSELFPSVGVDFGVFVLSKGIGAFDFPFIGEGVPKAAGLPALLPKGEADFGGVDPLPIDDVPSPGSFFLPRKSSPTGADESGVVGPLPKDGAAPVTFLEGSLFPNGAKDFGASNFFGGEPLSPNGGEPNFDGENFVGGSNFLGGSNLFGEEDSLLGNCTWPLLLNGDDGDFGCVNGFGGSIFPGEESLLSEDDTWLSLPTGDAVDFGGANDFGA